MTQEQYEGLVLAIGRIGDLLEQIDSRLEDIDTKLSYQNDNLLYDFGPKLGEISSILLFTS